MMHGNLFFLSSCYIYIGLYQTFLELNQIDKSIKNCMNNEKIYFQNCTQEFNQ